MDKEAGEGPVEGAHCHAKVVEQGALVIVCVGAHGWWWAAGHCLLIMVVLGVHPHSCCLIVCSHSLLVGDGGGSYCLVLWYCFFVLSWLCLLVGLLVVK